MYRLNDGRGCGQTHGHTSVRDRPDIVRCHTGARPHPCQCRPRRGAHLRRPRHSGLGCMALRGRRPAAPVAAHGRHAGESGLCRRSRPAQTAGTDRGCFFIPCCGILTVTVARATVTGEPHPFARFFGEFIVRRRGGVAGLSGSARAASGKPMG